MPGRSPPQSLHPGSSTVRAEEPEKTIQDPRRAALGIPRKQDPSQATRPRDLFASLAFLQRSCKRHENAASRLVLSMVRDFMAAPDIVIQY